MASVTLTRAALASVAELSSRYDAEKVIVIDRHNLIGSWHGVTILRAGGRAYRAVHSSGRVVEIGGLSAPDWQHELDELEAGESERRADRIDAAMRAELETPSRETLVAAIVDGIGAQLGRDGLLALHGELVVMPEAGGFVDAMLTALERAFMAYRGHSVRA